MKPSELTVAEALRLGLEHQQAGQFAAAQQYYQHILAIDGDHPEAWHLLGVLQHQTGDHQRAVEHIQRALTARPQDYRYHSNLGIVLKALGRLDAAIDQLRQAALLNPADAATLSNLGVVLIEHGQPEEATKVLLEAVQLQPDFALGHANLALSWLSTGEHSQSMAACRRALDLDPNLIQAHINLGQVLNAEGRFAEAIDTWRRALVLVPDSAESHVGLGQSLAGLGQHVEATEHLCRAQSLNPQLAMAHYALGNSLQHLNRWAEVEACYQEAIRCRHNFPEAHNNLGWVYEMSGRPQAAIEAYRSALQLRPGLATTHFNLATVLVSLGDFEAGWASYRKALDVDPNFVAARNNLGHALLQQGLLADAVEQYRAALGADRQSVVSRSGLLVALSESRPSAPVPEVVSRSNLLFALNYDPQLEPAELYREHLRFGQWLESSLRPAPIYNHQPDADRKLRIGYVSPDFHEHPVAYFLEPLLAHHEPSQFEFILYADVATPDEVSARMRSHAIQWRDTTALSNEKLAATIRADGVDILVDLAGHTSDNRLPAFVARPAPIQISYLGYPNTTGLTSIDYRLASRITDPAGEPLYTEQLWWLPGPYCCFEPPQAPPVGPLPALNRRSITFGSLHNLPKLNADVFDLWAELLRRADNSRLLIFRDQFHGIWRERLAREFAQRGIPPEQIVLQHVKPAGGFLQVFDEIDILLDPFPWSGHTIGCEALWMGVPVVTLRGQCHAGRLMADVLTAVGLSPWIAENREQYLRIALEMAQDVDCLAELRSRLREQMKTSALCDAAGFTSNLEHAYRAMWRRWCASQTGGN